MGTRSPVVLNSSSPLTLNWSPATSKDGDPGESRPVAFSLSPLQSPSRLFKTSNALRPSSSLNRPESLGSVATGFISAADLLKAAQAPGNSKVEQNDVNNVQTSVQARDRVAQAILEPTPPTSGQDAISILAVAKDKEPGKRTPAGRHKERNNTRAVVGNSTRSVKKVFKSASIIINSDDSSDETFQSIIIAHQSDTEMPTPLATKPESCAVETISGADVERRIATPQPTAEEQSSYFVKSVSAAGATSPVDYERLIEEDQAYLVSAGANDATHERSEGNVDADASSMPSTKLSRALSDFKYISGEPVKQSRKRSATSTPAVKRRRVEKKAKEPVKTPVRKVKPATASTVKKRTKSVKKKPQTITALATEAFRPVVEATEQQELVSTYFPLEKQDLSPRTESTKLATAATNIMTEPNPEAEPEPKPKRKRKVKVKIMDAEGNIIEPEPISKKTRESRAKPKPVKNEINYQLLSPRAARACEDSQGFIFGSSSQLANEESPTFIRDLQVAVHESEDYAESQVTPVRRSYRRVANAPHGTNLSIGQGMRELWSVSSRNSEGLLLEQASTDPAPTLPSSPIEIVDYKPELDKVPIDLQDENHVREDIQGDDHVTPDAEDTLATTSREESNLELTVESAGRNRQEPIVLLSDGVSTPRAASPKPQQHGSCLPSMFKNGRQALKPMNANLSLSRASPKRFITSKYTQSFSISTSNQVSPVKRARGRPRKDSLTVKAASLSPTRKRGRPPKPTSEPISSPPDFQCIDDYISDCEPAASPPRARNVPVMMSELSLKTSDGLSVEPITALSSLPTMTITQTTSLQPTETTSADLTNPSLTIPKSTDSAWPSIAATLFPQITHTILTVRTPAVSSSTAPKSHSASDSSDADPVQLDWYEKMLLYDPIVLEDLTAWLNAQGLRTARTVVVRKKVGRKAGKRKNGSGRGENGGEGGEGEGMQTEVVEEELKPWMVQKWCEEKSVCCLWKAGLRGGVRARY